MKYGKWANYVYTVLELDAKISNNILNKKSEWDVIFITDLG